MTRWSLTEDDRAILLLCSSLALGRGAERTMKPLSAAEWTAVAQRLVRSPWARPEALLGRSVTDLHEVLDLDLDLAERMAQLLGRGVQLALELERLSDRGIRPVTRASEGYPPKLKRRLQTHAPPVLFVAGAVELLRRPGIAVVGSRKAGDADLAFARELGRRCAASQLAVYSGSAPGVDQAAMRGALDHSGVVVGLTRDSLERAVRERTVREQLQDGRLALLTPFHPSVGFSAGLAMARNRYIYCLADYAVVVASDFERGGTWAGAQENLRGGWVPLFVRDGRGAPSGNRGLISAGGVPLTEPMLSGEEDLAALLAHAAGLSDGESEGATPSPPSPPEANAGPTPATSGDQTPGRKSRARRRSEQASLSLFPG